MARPFVDGKPALTVPENLLPGNKALFMYYAQSNHEEFSELINTRMSAIKRREPSLKEFIAEMTEFKKEC